MLLERVDKLRLEYTDQYVVVEGDLPRLARFKGKVGQVRTINVNGRALVEFDGDRSRYDLELDYLKVVEKPKPKVAPVKSKKPAAPKPKPASEEPKPKERLSELELARQEKEAAKKQAAETVETPAKTDEPDK